MVPNHLIAWMISGQPSEERDRAHRIAVRDARFTTDHRGAIAETRATPTSPTPFRGSRHFPAVPAGRSTADVAACCA